MLEWRINYTGTNMALYLTYPDGQYCVTKGDMHMNRIKLMGHAYETQLVNDYPYHCRILIQDAGLIVFY